MRVDLHAHTRFSRDATTAPGRLIERARARGLNRIAVTDHGQIRGALAAHALAPDLVIVGEEIKCADETELIGIFLEELVPEGLPVAETAARIHEQGGLVYAPHPYAYGSMPEAHAEAALAHADLAEVFNARAFLPRWNARATAAAHARGLPAFAGSDAHFPWEIGRAYTEVPAFGGAADLLRQARQARGRGLRTGTPLAHLASLSLAFLRRWGDFA